MAKAKSSAGTVRLTHLNGATVVVSADQADRLVAGGNFAAEKQSSAKSSTDDKK